MRLILRAVLALVVAFVVRGALTSGFQAAFGRQMLAAAGWTAGARPPTSYMTASVLAAFAASALAGVAAAVVLGRVRLRLALAYGALFTALALIANRSTLFGDPHPYEWPLILAPLVGMPLGAWLVVRLKPLPTPSMEPS